MYESIPPALANFHLPPNRISNQNSLPTLARADLFWAAGILAIAVGAAGNPSVIWAAWEIRPFRPLISFVVADQIDSQKLTSTILPSSLSLPPPLAKSIESHLLPVAPGTPWTPDSSLIVSHILAHPGERKGGKYKLEFDAHGEVPKAVGVKLIQLARRYHLSAALRRVPPKGGGVAASMKRGFPNDSLLARVLEGERGKEGKLKPSAVSWLANATQEDRDMVEWVPLDGTCQLLTFLLKKCSPTTKPANCLRVGERERVTWIESLEERFPEVFRGGDEEIHQKIAHSVLSTLLKLLKEDLHRLVRIWGGGAEKMAGEDLGLFAARLVVRYPLSVAALVRGEDKKNPSVSPRLASLLFSTFPNPLTQSKPQQKSDSWKAALILLEIHSHDPKNKTNFSGELGKLARRVMSVEEFGRRGG
ncbi:hypothetical protein AAMO2058_001541500 [Amorphochlora amoebiformis]